MEFIRTLQKSRSWSVKVFFKTISPEPEALSNPSAQRFFDNPPSGRAVGLGIRLRARILGLLRYLRLRVSHFPRAPSMQMVPTLGPKVYE